MMRIQKAQIILAGIFLIALLFNSGIVILTYVNGAIYSDNLLALIVSLLKIYSAPLAIIIGGFFAQRTQDPQQAPRTAFWFALAMTLIWNALLMWRSMAFVIASTDSVDDFSKYIETISSSAMFLVAGSLAYFFAKTAVIKQE